MGEVSIISKLWIETSFFQATPAEVPDYDDNSVAPVNPNAPIVEVTKI